MPGNAARSRRLDLLAITRFLGLIEGRLQVPIPKAWEETVKSAMGYGRKRIWFPPRLDLAMAARNDGQWPLERNGTHWLVKKVNQSIKIPADDHDPATDASVACASEWAYVAVYDSLSDAYRLFAVDQHSGSVIWSSKVWGRSSVSPPGVIVGRSGSDWHFANTRLSGEMLVVFGFSGQALYVEAFDRKTGKNRCRFSTAYFEFDAFPPRK